MNLAGSSRGQRLQQRQLLEFGGELNVLERRKRRLFFKKSQSNIVSFDKKIIIFLQILFI